MTGATGYIGKRLLPVLVEKGHEVICCVRDRKRFNPPESLRSKVQVIELDLLDRDSLSNIPNDIDGAYYLVHSMSSSKDYEQLEFQSALNFKEAMNETQVKHVVYLSGIINEDNLSKHLSSRKKVEEELGKGNYSLTTLRAGIIIGSGSASFEIIRDLGIKVQVEEASIDPLDVKMTHGSVLKLQESHLPVPTTDLRDGITQTWNWMNKIEISQLRGWFEYSS